MKPGEAGGEWFTCAACGAALWCYLAVRCPEDTTHRGKPVKAGEMIHHYHTAADPSRKARLADLRKRSQG